MSPVTSWLFLGFLAMLAAGAGVALWVYGRRPKPLDWPGVVDAWVASDWSGRVTPVRAVNRW